GWSSSPMPCTGCGRIVPEPRPPACSLPTGWQRWWRWSRWTLRSWPACKRCSPRRIPVPAPATMRRGSASGWCALPERASPPRSAGSSRWPSPPGHSRGWSARCPMASPRSVRAGPRRCSRRWGRWPPPTELSGRGGSGCGGSGAGGVHARLEGLDLGGEGRAGPAQRRIVEGGAADLPGSELRGDPSGGGVAEAGPPEAALQQLGMDLLDQPGVQPGERGPVRAGHLVVRGMQPVVEEQEVEERRGEAPRVVVLAPRVGVHVLDVVEEHDRPQRKERRDEEHQRPDLEAGAEAVERQRQGEEREVGSEEEDVLPDDGPVQARVSLLRLADVVLDRFRLVPAGDEEVGPRHPGVVGVGEAPGYGGVARLVHHPVMVEVVGRDPGIGRVAVEDA